jgi:hypothetical protein
MKHWELKVLEKQIRAEWNEAATFNMQCLWIHDGQWYDYHCFTVYGIESEHEALECILEGIRDELREDKDLWEHLEENPAEMEEAIIVLK